MDLNIDHIKKAYLFVKSYAYHENLNLFLKQRVAEFETKHTEMDEVFESILEVVDQEIPCNHKYFKDWLKSINYHLLPKLVERPQHFNDMDFYWSIDEVVNFGNLILLRITDITDE